MSPRNTRSRKGLLFLLLTAAATMAAACGRQELPQNALDPESSEARQLHDLWQIVSPIALVIFVLVQVLVVVVVVKFRARSSEERPKQIHGSTKLEIAWTIAPALLLVVVGVFTVITVFDINEQAEGAEVLNVKVIGHQWWWEYQYPDAGVVTANELHIPTGQQVNLELHSVDVIHNFWAPKLAGKVYAIPGRVNHMRIAADEPGDYSGQCAEYCGLSHANMRLKVIAQTPEDFKGWLEAQKQPARSVAGTGGVTGMTTPVDASADAGEIPVGVDKRLDAMAGEQLFTVRGCGQCHAINGLEGAEGVVGPNLTHLYDRKWFAGAVFELNERNLRRWLRDPPAMKPMVPENNQGMPNLGLSEDEITQLIAYLETLK